MGNYYLDLNRIQLADMNSYKTFYLLYFTYLSAGLLFTVTV